jgi:non-heme chloroperoxidase
MIAFGTAPAPPPLASIQAAGVVIASEIVDAPPPRRFRARDGTTLAYRTYFAAPDRIAVLIHGSSGSGVGMHGFAKALQAAGISAYALDVRGHGDSGRKGDIEYVGQLEDDVIDLLAEIGTPKDAKRILAGFSSGGGFVLRFAGGPGGDRFDGYLLLAPLLPWDAPTSRPNSGGWAAPSIPRIIGLTVLSALGIHWFEDLPVLAFAVPPQDTSRPRTPVYSYRLWRNFSSHYNWQEDVRGIRRPTIVLIGDRDELFFADQYSPVLHAVRPDIAVETVPGLDHIGLVISPTGRAAAVKAFNVLNAR